MKKLQLKKEVISKLNKSNMQQIVGGAFITITPSCGAMCFSAHIDCAALPPSEQPTMNYPVSFPDGGVTCGGGVCGSDVGCTTTGYSTEICTGQVSVCVC